MPDHDGRVALVTGGSSGIGEGACLELAEQGAKVVVHGADLAEAQQVADRIVSANGTAIAVAGPIERAETSVCAVAAAIAEFGRLDTLVTSAGIQRYGDAVSTPESTWDEVMSVNAKGVYLAAHAALPAIRRAGAGTVVIVASVQATATQASVAAYTASKGALVALARAMAMDESEYGVRVNSVSPGSVDTPMLRSAAALFGDGTPEGTDRIIRTWGTAHPLGRPATPREVGAVIAFLAGPRASFVTGDDVRVDGGLLARAAAALPDKE